MAARTFPEGVPGQAVTDPVQLKEEAEKREAYRLLQRAEHISKQPGSTAETIGNMISGVLTMGVGEEPMTLQAIGEMHPILQAALAFPVVATVTGPLALPAGWVGQTTRVAARQVTTGLSQHAKSLVPLYVPEAEAVLLRVGSRFNNLIGDLDPVKTGFVYKPTPPLPSTNIIGLRPIQPGLTRREQLMNLVGRVFQQPLNEELGTPAIREKLRVEVRIKSVSTALSQKFHAQINDNFKFNKKNQIEDRRCKTWRHGFPHTVPI